MQDIDFQEWRHRERQPQTKRMFGWDQETFDRNNQWVFTFSSFTPDTLKYGET